MPLLIYALRTPTKIAAASSTFIVCFSSLTGFLGYASVADIDWMFILPAAASFAGGRVGARSMSSRLKGKTIRAMFSRRTSCREHFRTRIENMISFIQMEME